MRFAKLNHPKQCGRIIKKLSSLTSTPEAYNCQHLICDLLAAMAEAVEDRGPQCGQESRSMYHL